LHGGGAELYPQVQPTNDFASLVNHRAAQGSPRGQRGVSSSTSRRATPGEVEAQAQST
jgi:hypothetical protein